MSVESAIEFLESEHGKKILKKNKRVNKKRRRKEAVKYWAPIMLDGLLGVVAIIISIIALYKG